MNDRTVTMRGTPLHLRGIELRVGDRAPDIRLQQRSPEGLKDITWDDFDGKNVILSVVPSLDTPVCEKQTVRFNDEVISLPANVEVLTVSMDLPFAQARFCSEKGTHQVQTASDHRTAEFGEAYGVLIEELRLLARAIFVVDVNRQIRYVEYVPEVTDQPDYDRALAAARELTD
ncbi:MAG: thiol peroxidase [Chthonomonadales bacterium]|nr:thiol peroxidase [Chthonomonadales bacterium]